jgi:hypothetical protein
MMVPVLACRTFLLLAGAAMAQAPRDYFVIHIVDEQTGHGVPLVELRTTSEAVYYTDSNGIVAFYEPGFMDQDVYFHIFSHGYEVPPDMFQYRGKALKVAPGGRATIRLHRRNVAERLYRVTGEGVYRDSLLTNQPAPVREPALNGKVMGQDTVMAALYQGRIFWIFGDTNKPAYPLGNFASSGAISELTDDPERGINLRYFADHTGFSKKMAPLPEKGLVWLHALLVLPDDAGRPRLVAHFGRMKSLGERLESGLVAFNNQKEEFERLVSWGAEKPLLEPSGRPFRVRIGGEEYIYFVWPKPTPVVRVKADWKALRDPRRYEGLVCPETGSCVWKTGQAPSVPFHITDIETGRTIEPRMVSAYWNVYRRRWIGILEKLPGENWYAEADTPAGPWVYARRIIEHANYTFYWAAHLPWFDRDAGRRIYIMGTYTNAFSGNPVKTPRYNYNQIMYALSLDDSSPRLARAGLPAEERLASDARPS